MRHAALDTNPVTCFIFILNQLFYCLRITKIMTSEAKIENKGKNMLEIFALCDVFVSLVSGDE